jgi:hypothetical protein
MSGVLSIIIDFAKTIIAAAIGFWGASLLQKRGKKQSLIDAIMQKRITTYSEALSFVYEVEKNRTNATGLLTSPAFGRLFS